MPLPYLEVGLTASRCSCFDTTTEPSIAVKKFIRQSVDICTIKLK